MNKIATKGRRYLKNDRWHDDNGPIPDEPLDWDPPMTEAEIHEAALTDPDAQPLTAAQLARTKRVAPVKTLRWKLRLSQAEFSARFGIPLGTLRDWEQHKAEPDSAARVLLKVIEENPDVVQRAAQAAA